MLVKIALVCVLCLARLFVAAQALDSNSYIGAVAEYSPKLDKNNATNTMSLNVAEYEKLIETASKRGADIIVFPEGGLNTRSIKSPIPDPVDHVIPCDGTFKTTDAVVKLSCAAKKFKIYTVVNLAEKRPCDGEDCPSVGHYTYNTNVVFDRNGMVVARYAKFNLFDELGTNKPENPEMVFFDTDFGVRFGTFTCFDIHFTVPAQRLVQQYGITDFVFTTHWFSELPFLTALQAQRGWAETNNVNLLASGNNCPFTGSGGSGIYNGKFGAIVEIMPETTTTKLLIANIPKINKDKNSCNSLRTERSILPSSNAVIEQPGVADSTPDAADESFNLLSDQIYLFNTVIIDSKKRFEQKVCGRDNFCCNFDVTMELVGNNTKNYNYRAVVMNGVRKFGMVATGGVQVCGIVLCSGPNPADCTKRAKDASGIFKIKNIRIEGEFLSRNAFQMPSTLTDGKKLLPLPSYKYDFSIEKKDKKNKVSLELIWSVANLHTFAIWGRDVSRDGEIPYPVAKAPSTVSTSVLTIVISTFILLWR